MGALRPRGGRLHAAHVTGHGRWHFVCNADLARQVLIHQQFDQVPAVTMAIKGTTRVCLKGGVPHAGCQ